MLRSIPPITSTGPGAPIRRRGLARRPRRSIRPEESVKEFEYKPLAREKMAGRTVKVDTIPHQLYQFSEVDEVDKTIIFHLPLDEDQISWEIIKEGVLKVKSSRLDFQYKEEVKIPPEWEGKPEVIFLNGILAFSWRNG